jgi:hypothetical protein
MSFAVSRAVAFILPILILPAAALGATKVGTVTSSNGAVVAHDGKVVPATPNMPLYQGDKVITLSGGSANVQLADKSLKLGGSSMVPMDNQNTVDSMDPKSSSKGDAKHEAAEHLARADHDNDGDHDHGNHFGHCKGEGHEHHDDDGLGRSGGHDHDHDCPVSP